MRRLIENIRVAFQSLNASKLRAFLTMLGIIIGVGAVITVMAVGAGAQQSILSNIQSMGTNLLTVSPGRGNTQFRPAAAALKALEVLKAAEVADRVSRLPGENYTLLIIKP